MKYLLALVVSVSIWAASAVHAAIPPYCQMMAAPAPLSRTILIKPADGPDCELWRVEEYLASHAQPVKDEFESTADYNKRLQSNPAITPSGASLSAPFAVVVHISDDHIAYDADRQTLDFTTAYLFSSRYLDRIGRVESAFELSENILAPGGFLILKADTSTSNYDAHNAFGATWTIARTTGDAWALRIPTSSQSAGPDTGIPIASAAAKIAKPNLYVVMVGTAPVRPTGLFENRTSAAIDKPNENDITIHYIEVRPSYAFVVRGDTGEVLLHLAYAADGSETVVPVGSDTGTLAQNPTAPQANRRPLLNTPDKPQALRQPQADVASVGNASDLVSLNAVQRGAIGEAVRECWTRDAGTLNADTFQAHLIVTTDAGGITRKAEISPGDPAFRPGSPLHVFAQRAVQAVLAARCSALPLPPGMMGQAHRFDFVFKP